MKWGLHYIVQEKCDKEGLQLHRNDNMYFLK